MFFFFLFFEIFTCVFILKQLFAEGEVIIDEYSPRRSRGEYSPIIFVIVCISGHKWSLWRIIVNYDYDYDYDYFSISLLSAFLYDKTRVIFNCNRGS